MRDGAGPATGSSSEEGTVVGRAKRVELFWVLCCTVVAFVEGCSPPVGFLGGKRSLHLEDGVPANVLGQCALGLRSPGHTDAATVHTLVGGLTYCI